MDEGGDGTVRANGRAAGGFALRHDAWGRLVLTDAAGHEHVGAYPVRAFPFSDPRRGIALCDAQGREIIWVEGLDDLPPPLRQVLEEELGRRHLMPHIRRVRKITRSAGPSEWEVETDRGPTRFLLGSEDDVRTLPGNRALVVDAQGIRYLIPDTRALDAPSRLLLERYL